MTSNALTGERLLSLFLVTAALVASASAATITVNQSGSTYDLSAACSSATIAMLPGTDGQTSLSEAICAANNAGGADTIALGVNVTLDTVGPETTVVGFGAAGAPDVFSDITITTGAGSSISRSSSAGNFRIFTVVPGGSLTLDGVSVRGGQIALQQFLPGFANVLQGAGIHVAGGAGLNLIGGAVVADHYLDAPNTLQTESNEAEGAGIWNDGTLTIDSSTVRDNHAFGGKNLIFHTAGDARGGGVFNSGSLTVTNATFSGNKARGGGGSVVEGNFSSRAGFGKGGGIFNAAGGSLSVNAGSFTDNRAEAGLNQSGVAGNAGGGAIYNDGSLPNITGTLFEGNIVQGDFAAVAGNSYGGAVFNGEDGTIDLIRNVIFRDNHAFGPITLNLIAGDLFEMEIEIDPGDCPPQSVDHGACEAFKLITETTIPSLFSHAGGNNRGGALYTEGLVTLIDGTTEFRLNEALGAGAIFHSGGSGYGGAIAVGDGGRIDRIEDVVFDQNEANGGNAGDSGGDGKGGAIWIRAGGEIGTIDSSTFTLNVADGANGYPNPTKVKVSKIKDIRKLLSDGGAGKGGAIYVDDRFSLFEGGPVQVNPGAPAKLDLIVDSTFDRNTAYGGGAVNGEAGSGGAIYTDGSLLAISGGSITNNLALGEFGLITSSGFGGGVVVNDQEEPLTITGTRVADNRAEGGDGFGGIARGQGGGIYSNQTSVNLAGVTISGNVVQGGDSGGGDNAADGAGVFMEVGNLTVTDSIIENNSAFAGGSVAGGNSTGGGIASLGDFVTIVRSRISGNHIKAGAGIGGGNAAGGGLSLRTRFLFPGDQKTVITDSVFRDNTAEGGHGITNCHGRGGALQIGLPIVTEIRGSTFSGNLATGGGGEACDGEGGAIYTDSQNLSIVNSTLHGNRAIGSNALFDAGDGQGGAIHSSNLTRIYNSTISRNHVQSGGALGGGFADGGGVFVVDETTTAMFSSIVSGNTRGSDEQIQNCWGNILSLDYNLFDQLDGDSCTLTGDMIANNRIGPPNMGDLANNGGPDAPELPPFTRALGGGSDAIDNGNCVTSFSIDGFFDFANTITTDQRGGARVAPCDIGAFELGAVVPVGGDPELSASPAPGPFAITGLTATASRNLTIMNVGGAGTMLDVSQVSLSAGYTASNLPISGLSSGGSSVIAVQCTPGSSAPGTLVLSSNEPGAPTYTWNLTCAITGTTTPVFASNPPAGTDLLFTAQGSELTLIITNDGAAGTLLDVAKVSSHPGFTVTGGLPISALTSGDSATITIRLDDPLADPALLVLRTNESGNPSYSFNLVSAVALAAIPLFDPKVAMLLAILLAALGTLTMRGR